MKLGKLRSIGHNIADSLADGNGFLIGLYSLDVFGEAKQSVPGFIEVDFLHGSSTGGTPSSSLARAFRLYSEVLPSFCEKHGASCDAFRKLCARFFGDGQLGRFIVTVGDHEGRQATDEYAGSPGKRVRVFDPLGCIRKKPTIISRVNVPRINFLVRN